jgi:small subunit ribosomal protein S13
MARIAGIDLPPNKRVEIGLTSIYGIGRSRAIYVLTKAEVPGSRATCARRSPRTSSA